VDLELHLVHVPLVAGPWPAAPQPGGELRPELAAPLMHGLMSDSDAALRHELLHVAQAQAEPVVQPHAVADDFRWETMALVGDRESSGDGFPPALLPTAPPNLPTPPRRAE